MEGLRWVDSLKKEFKDDVVGYQVEYKNLGLSVCAKNLRTSRIALCTWSRDTRINNGEVPTRGSGNYQRGEASENATLRKGLRK